MKPTDPMARMYKHYGKNHLKTCGTCINCQRWQYSRSGPKCLCYDPSPEPETDWDPASMACGHYNRLHDAKREKLIVTLYQMSTPKEVPGQCSMLEG